MRKNDAFLPSRARGFTLLEVLLTLVILSVGLLGLGAMQIIGLKSAGTANYRTQATLIAADMAERMRLNPEAVRTGLFRDVASGSHPATACDVLPTMCSAWEDGTGTDCTWQLMAAYDINMMACGTPVVASAPAQRRATGVNQLPSGTLSIKCVDFPTACNGVNDNEKEHVITITWQEQSQNADGSRATTTQNLALPFVPGSL